MSATQENDELIRMEKSEYEKLYQFVDAEKYHQLRRAIEKAGGKPLGDFFSYWFTAHLLLNAVKSSGGLPKRGMRALHQTVNSLKKIAE